MRLFDWFRRPAPEQVIKDELGRLSRSLFPGGYEEIVAAGQKISALLGNRIPPGSASKLYASTKYLAHTASDKSKERVVAYIERQGMGQIDAYEASEIYDRFIADQSDKQDHAEALINQTIGGQSLMYRLFRQVLGVSDSQIRVLELTYFAASVTTFIYLHLSNNPDKERVLDTFARGILQKGIASAGEDISLTSCIAQYQQRYAEYSAIIRVIFDPQGRPNPEVTLLLHAFESVTSSSAREHMVQIALAGGAINQYIAGLINFVKTKLRP